MDNTEPRHIDRRDQGLRRQRLVTQAAAIGAAMLSIAFGWVFAQGSSAAAEEKGSTEPAAVEASEKAKTPEKPKTSEKAKSSEKSSPPESEEEPQQDEAEEEAEDEAGAELAPPPAAPEPAPQQESDATSGGS